MKSENGHSVTLRRAPRRLMMACITLLAAGCAGAPAHAPKAAAVSLPVSAEKPERSTPPDEGNIVTEGALKQCQGELGALRVVSPARWQSSQAEFTKIMTAASQYAGVRAAANKETQAAMDALYEYRITRFCANISQALMTALADRGTAG